MNTLQRKSVKEKKLVPKCDIFRKDGQTIESARGKWSVRKFSLIGREVTSFSNLKLTVEGDWEGTWRGVLQTRGEKRSRDVSP